MVKETATLGVLLLLSGCSTHLTDRQMEAMHAPTLTLNCETGCSASYTDPRDRPSMPTNGWDALNNAVNATAGVVTSTAPWAAIGLTATQGIRNAVGDNNSSTVDSRDSSVSNDNRENSVRTDSSDNSVRTDNSVDSTHTPTVVNQPSPVVTGSGQE